MANSEIRKLVRELQRNGWTVKQGRKHYKAVHPLGGIVCFSVTPSDYHALENIKRDIRKVERTHLNDSTISKA